MSKARDSAGVIAPPPLLALAAIVLGFLLDWWIPVDFIRTFLPMSARIVLAALLAVTSAGFAVPALLAFRAAGTHVEPWKPATALVTTGIYRRLRNPMYAGLILFVAGLAILVASDWMLVTTLALGPVLHFGVVKREERYLDAKFGDAYRRYRQTVPRYGWPS